MVWTGVQKVSWRTSRKHVASEPRKIVCSSGISCETESAQMILDSDSCPDEAVVGILLLGNGFFFSMAKNFRSKIEKPQLASIRFPHFRLECPPIHPNASKSPSNSAAIRTLTATTCLHC